MCDVLNRCWFFKSMVGIYLIFSGWYKSTAVFFFKFIVHVLTCELLRMKDLCRGVEIPEWATMRDTQKESVKEGKMVWLRHSVRASAPVRSMCVWVNVLLTAAPHHYPPFNTDYWHSMASGGAPGQLTPVCAYLRFGFAAGACFCHPVKALADLPPFFNVL